MIFRNLYSFMKGHPFFFALTLVCIFVSTILMLFGYGMYQNYMLEKQEFDQNSTIIYFDHPNMLNENGTIQSSGIVTKQELDRCISMISSDTLNCIENFAVDVYDSSNPTPSLLSSGAMSHFRIQDGVYHPYYQVYENGMQWNGAKGRYFTTNEYSDGANCVTVPPNFPLPTQDGFYEIGDTMQFEGEKYKIICLMGAFPTIIYTAVPDSAFVGYLTIYFRQPPTYTQYEEVRTAFATLSDRLIMTDFVPFYEEDYWLYNTILLVSILIAVVAAFNLVVLYQYILHKRQKALAICQICGCTKGRAIWMYSAESALLMIPTYCLGVLVYHFGLLPLLAKIFPYITTAYSLRLYGVAFAILVSVCLFAMLLLSVYIVNKYSIVERKGGVI